MKYYKMMFFIFMTAGTLITISSYTWLSMWLGLEINLMSIIPLLTDTKNKYPSEAALKYFTSQALASLILILSSIIIMLKNEQITFFENFSLTLIYSSIFLKVGATPFHAWFPEVMEGLSWSNCLLMLTWQKLAPMVIILNNFKFNTFIFSVIILSLIFSGILGFNQISMRKILAYSSINHIAWMLTSMIQTKVIWMIYFIIYSMITMIIVLTFNNYKIFFINQMNIFKNSKLENLIISANFFSLAGLPPFLGFFPKWLTINSLILEQNYFLSTILISFTLISIFFYLRLTFSSLTFFSIESSIKTKVKMKFFIMLANVLIMFSLVLVTLILNSL